MAKKGTREGEEVVQVKTSELQALVDRAVQKQAQKGLFDPGTQADRVQRRNNELEAEVSDARHALVMALQERHEFRQFIASWNTANAKHVSLLVERANRLLPGEED